MNTQLDVLEPGDRPRFIEGWTEVPSHIDIRYAAVQLIPHLVDLSRQAVDELGESYRGFNVGTAFLVQDTTGGRNGIYFGGNYTPFKGAEWNCAEKRAKERIQAAGFDKVIAMAVAGPVQADSESGLVTPTLHPCGRCRGMMCDCELFDGDTLIVTTTLDESELEIFTLDGLLSYHETGVKPPFPSDFHPMLEISWDSFVNYDPTVDEREMEILMRMRDLVRQRGF